MKYLLKGNGCGAAGKPGVYSGVFAQLSWVRRTANKINGMIKKIIISILIIDSAFKKNDFNIKEFVELFIFNKWMID